MNIHLVKDSENEWLTAITISLILIIVGLLIGILSSSHLNINHAANAHYQLNQTSKLDFLANWDGARYLSIAKNGYNNQFITGWLPLYPLLIRFVHLIINSYLISGLIISWISLIGALYFYQKIIKIVFNTTNNMDSLKATLLFGLFPSGVYLLAVYTESLFACLALGAIYYALKSRYIVAALLTMFATATHINGVFILIFIALILWERKEKLFNILIGLAIGSLGIVSYMLYLYLKFNNALDYVTAQKDHGWLHKSIFSHLSSFGILNGILALLIIACVIFWWNRKRSFSIYSMFYLLIPLVGGQLGGYLRYVMVAFPLEFMIYDLLKRSRYAYGIVISLFVVSWIYILIRFSTGYIIG
jgi:Gpi18-like mannosyltransferase